MEKSVSEMGACGSYLPNARVVPLWYILDEVNGGPRRLYTQRGRGENSWVKRPCIQPLNCIVRKATGPVPMMNRHTMNGRKTVVVCEVQDHNVKDQWRMCSFNLMLRS